MIVSMTGFGRSNVDGEKLSITVELKTVNHRFLEFHMRMPRQLLVIEERIKKKLNEFITRGRVEVFVTIAGASHYGSKVHVDWELLDAFLQSMRDIQEKYHFQQEISLQDILSREEIITLDDDHSRDEELERKVLEAVEEAAIQLRQMRLQEGKALEKDIEHQLSSLSRIVHSLKTYAPKVVEQYAIRLRKRMEEFSSGQIDETRLVNEVAIFADKADINEELTRLQSHIVQFQSNLGLSQPIGRKLDFLLQEMNREVNTIGSKANDSEVAREVVEMKSLLEKMKEQVQNIE